MRNNSKRIEELKTINLLKKGVFQINTLEKYMCEHEKYQVKIKGELKEVDLVYSKVKNKTNNKIYLENNSGNKKKDVLCKKDIEGFF